MTAAKKDGNRRQRRAQEKRISDAARRSSKLSARALKLFQARYPTRTGHKVQVRQSDTNNFLIVASVDPNIPDLPVLEDGFVHRGVLYEVPVRSDDGRQNIDQALTSLIHKLL